MRGRVLLFPPENSEGTPTVMAASHTPILILYFWSPCLPLSFALVRGKSSGRFATLGVRPCVDKTGEEEAHEVGYPMIWRCTNSFRGCAAASSAVGGDAAVL